MEIALRSVKGGSAGAVQVSDAMFSRPYNEGLVHEVVTAWLAGARAGTKAQKTRAEVRGGGIKPWKQKGTGRARAGTIRGPIWRGGGRTFAAVPRSHAVKVNRKAYRAAIGMILSELVRQQRLVVVDDISMERPKTKDLLAQLAGLGVRDALIVTNAPSDALRLAARNVHTLDVLDAGHTDPVSLIGFEHVVMTADAIRKIEGLYA